MFKKLKENKKGFTLVELIVVLVILAILAALLVPALTGYIDKAKKKSVIAETRQCVMAAQTLIDEVYATKTVGTNLNMGTDVTYDNIKKLAEVKGTVNEVTLDTTNTDTPNKIKTLKYTDVNSKYVCEYKPGVAGNSDGDYDISAYVAPTP